MLSYSQNFLRQFSWADTTPDSELIYNNNGTLSNPQTDIITFDTKPNTWVEIDTQTPTVSSDSVYLMENETFKILKEAFINLAENVNAFRNDGIGVLFDDSDRFTESFSMETPKISSCFVDCNLGNDFVLGQYKFKQIKFIDYKTCQRDPNTLSASKYTYDTDTCFNTPILHFGKSFANVPWVFGLNPRVYKTMLYTNGGQDYVFNGLAICVNPYAQQVIV